ncbi:MAG: glycosyl hydrolase family 57 [Cyanobium sp.]
MSCALTSECLDSSLSLPPIAGAELELLALPPQRPPLSQNQAKIQLNRIRAGFACALHMHQPIIPAGADGELISHLQFMFEHPGDGDNHNAAAFAHCYRRLADIIPQLIREGGQPRIMLDYSGTLLWGFEQMRRHDILDALRFLATDPSMVPHVEWLGTCWGHAVVPSTPIPDLKLHIQAWRQHFSALFGAAALQRVKGFSPPEMHLPNHPDSLYEFVKALKECGYSWLLVQEHSVENLDGSSLSREQVFIPNQLIARNSTGEEVSIVVLVKTQGSDTKLVGQMQPYYEALDLSRQAVGDHSIPALVSQIADGENGGVMMNEFPEAFIQAHRRIASQAGNADTLALNGTEYLDLLQAAGVESADYPCIQAIQQHKLWKVVGPRPTPSAVAAAISQLQASDPQFSMAGASWTNHLSWVEGYENVLEPMQRLSARFHQTFDPWVARDSAVPRSRPYREALLHLLLLETSCFRYWGQGRWTDYARELDRRGQAAIDRAAGLGSGCSV